MDKVRGGVGAGDGGVEQRPCVEPILPVHDRTQVPPYCNSGNSSSYFTLL